MLPRAQTACSHTLAAGDSKRRMKRGTAPALTTLKLGFSLIHEIRLNWNRSNSPSLFVVMCRMRCLWAPRQPRTEAFDFHRAPSSEQESGECRSWLTHQWADCGQTKAVGERFERLEAAPRGRHRCQRSPPRKIRKMSHQFNFIRKGKSGRALDLDILPISSGSGPTEGRRHRSCRFDKCFCVSEWFLLFCSFGALRSLRFVVGASPKEVKLLNSWEAAHERRSNRCFSNLHLDLCLYFWTFAFDGSPFLFRRFFSPK